MKNLLSIYEEIFRDIDSWKYYSSMIPVNPFENSARAKLFIKNFIQLSGKADDNLLYDDINPLEGKRINHIVSTFFLGIYIYNNISIIKYQINIILKVYQKNNPYSKIEFSFLWFLICLFHDLGYQIETNDSYSDFNDFLSRKCSVPYFLKSSVGVPGVYFNTYEAYFNYKIKSVTKSFGGKPDHGICGGIILYNVLNNILNRWSKDRESSESKKLYWDKKLLSIYKRVSWVILSHNIYFAWKGSENYKDYTKNLKLKELILTRETGPLVKLNKHPLLFLFLLVDCIEPIKQYKEYNDYCNFRKLSSINMECSKNTLTIDFPAEILDEKFAKSIKDLEWYLIPEIKINNGLVIFTFANC